MPTLIWNTSTGSDTTASGSQGSITANGTSASYSGSVVTLDGSPDLSGFDANEDVLWLQTSTGRQFFDLSSVDDGADTVTCVNAPAGTASGLTWGIGGKRNDWDNTDTRNVFTDMKAGWIVETETAQTISSKITLGCTIANTGETGTIRGSSGSRKTISVSVNDAVFYEDNAALDRMAVRNLKLQCTAGTRTTAYGIQFDSSNSTSRWIIENCEIGDSTNTLQEGIFASAGLDRPGYLVIWNCYIHDCTGSGVRLNSSAAAELSVQGSCIVGNAEHGIYMNVLSEAIYINNVIANNGTATGTFYGLGMRAGLITVVAGNTFYNNDAANLQIISANADSQIYHYNNLYSTADYHVGGTTTTVRDANMPANSNNFYYNHTTAKIQPANMTVGDNAVEDQDPLFTDAANNDFSLGTTSPAKAAGYPGDIGGSGLSTGYMDIGAVQRQEPAGGGGELILINRSNSLITR